MRTLPLHTCTYDGGGEGMCLHCVRVNNSMYSHRPALIMKIIKCVSYKFRDVIGCWEKNLNSERKERKHASSKNLRAWSRPRYEVTNLVTVRSFPKVRSVQGTKWQRYEVSDIQRYDLFSPLHRCLLSTVYSVLSRVLRRKKNTGKSLRRDIYD